MLPNEKVRKHLVSKLGILTILLICATPSHAQYAEPPEQAAKKPTQRYANMPEEAVPFRKFTKPYKEWFIDEDTLKYNGAARERESDVFEKLESVNIGFLGPLEDTNPESPYGVAMLHGAQLAIEAVNARGGYRGTGTTAGKPFRLKVHNDSALWGASSTEAVKMDFDEHVIAILGAVDGVSTHIMLRVCLKLEIPIMDTATTDPTVTETRIPWLIHNFPDDRQQGYALADYVFKQQHLKRIGVLRTQSRYARVGVAKFIDEAKRLGRVPALELKFERGDKDFANQLRMLENAHIDGLVIWGEPTDAALILKQMRSIGMKQPVFGASRIVYPQFLETAGPAAEGFVATAAMDPTRTDVKWMEFAETYRAKFNQEPDAYAAYAYDGMTMLLAAVDKAGLNRGLIMDVFRDYQTREYVGVSGRVQFDHTLNNIVPPPMARVEGGKFVYWVPQQTSPAPAKEHAGDR